MPVKGSQSFTQKISEISNCFNQKAEIINLQNSIIINVLPYKLVLQILKVHSISLLYVLTDMCYPNVNINQFPKHNAFKAEPYLKQLTSLTCL